MPFPWFDIALILWLVYRVIRGNEKGPGVEVGLALLWAIPLLVALAFDQNLASGFQKYVGLRWPHAFFWAFVFIVVPVWLLLKWMGAWKLMQGIAKSLSGLPSYAGAVLGLICGAFQAATFTIFFLRLPWGPIDQWIRTGSWLISRILHW